MTYAEVVKKFLAKVQAIAATNPKYRQPGDGSDGTCDCIGLLIGAIRRMGLKWTGIHGSNWCARRELVKLEKTTNPNDLELGDAVLKAYAPGEKGYDLPARYKKGGKYYNGDLNDYYHAGTVTQVNPLRITHMSSRITVDPKQGKWFYHGKLKILVNAAGGNVPVAPVTPDTPTAGCRAVVVAESGGTVNLRNRASRAGKILARVPLGTTITITEPGEKWATVKYGSISGYMMAEFLDIIGDGKGKY